VKGLPLFRVREWVRSVRDRVAQFGYTKTALVLALTIIEGVIVARYCYSFITGYIVPDEAYYYNTYVLDRQPIMSYREVFLTIFMMFFGPVKSVWQFFASAFAFSSLCAIGTIIVSYKLVKRLQPSDKVSGLLLLSLPLFPVLVVMAATATTEPLGLLFAMTGVYLTLRYVQEGSSVSALLSGASFILAYKVREPYLLLAAGFVLLYMVVAAKRRTGRGFLAYLIPVLPWFPVPVRLQPLDFAQPVLALVTGLVSRLPAYFSALLSVWTPVPPATTATTATTACAVTAATTACAVTASTAAITATPAVTLPPILPPVETLLNPTVSVATSSSPHPELAEALGLGLFYGYNPLFAVFALASVALAVYLLLRSRSSEASFVLLSMILSLGTFAVSVMFTIVANPTAVTAWTSTLVRAAHTSLPSFVGFGGLYQRLKPKRVAVLIMVTMLLMSTQVPGFAATFQRSLSREPVDRLSLDYRAPYYRMYLIAEDSGKTLVFGGLHMRGIRIYMSMLPNVKLVPVPGTIDELRGWLAIGWDAVFLYDDWVTIAVPEMIGAYPSYYGEILKSREFGGHALETLWVDGESYALKMTTLSPVLCTGSMSDTAASSSSALFLGESRPSASSITLTSEALVPSGHGYLSTNTKLAGDFFSHNEFRTVSEISADFEHYDIPVQG